MTPASPPPVDPPEGRSAVPGPDGRPASKAQARGRSSANGPSPAKRSSATPQAKAAASRNGATRSSKESTRATAAPRKAGSSRAQTAQLAGARPASDRGASNGAGAAVADRPPVGAKDDRSLGSGRRLISSSGRTASAGRILGVGLLCFGLWFLLDAHQLHREAAVADNDGARRSAALAVTGPVAAIANFLHLSGLVNWGDTVLNHNGGPGNNVGLPPPVTIPPHPAPPSQTPGGASYLPHGYYNRGVPKAPPPPPPPPGYSLPPVPQPTPSHPLTILDIGDSIGEDLGFGLGDLFTGNRSVHLLQDAVLDTGLVQEQYYDWPGHLQQELDQSHPGAVIVMLGTNDDQNLAVNGNVYVPLSAGWVKAYTARVRLLMGESAAAGARVIWVGLPPMGGGNITNAFVKRVNGIFISEAKQFPGVTYVPSWSLFAGPKGQFEEYLDIGGSEQPVRASDGVHLDPAGWDLLAHALVAPMQAAWKVNLHT